MLDAGAVWAVQVARIIMGQDSTGRFLRDELQGCVKLRAFNVAKTLMVA
jgi:hypothetical protein